MISVFTDALASPKTESSDKRVYFLIAQQKSNIIGGHIRIADIVLGKHLTDAVKLFLKGGILLGQLSLQGTFRHTNLFGNIFDTASTSGQKLGQGATNPCGGGFVDVKLCKPFVQLRLRACVHSKKVV